jgi:hypothetical protein
MARLARRFTNQKRRLPKKNIEKRKIESIDHERQPSERETTSDQSCKQKNVSTGINDTVLTRSLSSPSLKLFLRGISQSERVFLEIGSREKSKKKIAIDASTRHCHAQGPGYYLLRVCTRLQQGHCTLDLWTHK